MADKDGTSRRKKKSKRQTIRVPSDEVPRRPATGPTMAVVRPEEDEEDLSLDGSIEVRLTPIPDPPAHLLPDVPQARQKTIVDMELPAGLLEMFGEPGAEAAPAPALMLDRDAEAARALLLGRFPADGASASAVGGGAALAPAGDQRPAQTTAEDPVDVPVEVEVVDAEPSPGGAPADREPPKAAPDPGPRPVAPARPFAAAANASGPVVVVAPIRSVGEPLPAPAPPPPEPAAAPPPPRIRAKRVSTQPGITRVSLPLDETDDEGWSLPAESSDEARSSPGRALLPAVGVEDRADDERSESERAESDSLRRSPGPPASEARLGWIERGVRGGPRPTRLDDDVAPRADEATQQSVDEQDDLASEPTRVRPVPSRRRPASDTTQIDLGEVEGEVVRDERDSDPPTPIEVDASDEVGTAARGLPSEAPKLSVVASPTPTPIPAVPPPPPASPLGGRSSFAVPPLATPPPVPGQLSLRAEPDRDAAAGRRKKPKKWWEDFFGEDFLRTVPRMSDEYTARECDFIEASLGVERGAKLLDLGCGAGRQAVNLAERGYDMVGLDLSLAMLTHAQALAESCARKVNFMQGDMRELNFDGAFDGVLCMGTTFGLFDDESNVQVIKNIHRALKENGALLVEVANRDFVLRGQPNLIWFEGDGCACMEETTVNYITSRLHVKRTVILDDGGQREAEYSVRLFSLHELGRLLHDSGFRVVEVSGHFATRGAFFGFDSPRLIILAEKRAASETTSPGKEKADRDSE